jgi:hypothetical protein
MNLVKLVNTNKLIFDASKINNIDSVKGFLKNENNIHELDFIIELICIGLFVIEFRNQKDKGIKFKEFRLMKILMNKLSLQNLC